MADGLQNRDNYEQKLSGATNSIPFEVWEALVPQNTLKKLTTQAVNWATEFAKKNLHQVEEETVLKHLYAYQ